MTPVATPPENGPGRAPEKPLHERPLVPATLGIRHFSPASARALTSLLESLQPQCILLEAPADAAQQLLALGAAETRPPVGLVGLSSPTDDARFLYPLAPESPEWIAVRWAHARGCALEGIDLPGAHQLALARVAEQAPGDTRDADPYARFAARAGVSDFDVWWERQVEHAPSPEAYAEVIRALALGLREQPWPARLRGEWALRESFMRRRIREVLATGVPPERCVVVCGAIHAPALTHERAELLPTAHAGDAGPSSDAHAASWAGGASMPGLQWFPVVLTSERMRSSSGAGAAHPPFAYLQLLAQAQRDGRFEAVAPRFLGRVAALLRASGASTGPSEVIDAVRLGEQLAALHGSDVVTLQDLSDAAITCFNVAPDRIASAIDVVSRGSLVGRLVDARPLLALELERRLEALGLPRLEVGAHHTIELDLRPGAGSKASERSTLLHRLRALPLPGIHRLQAEGSGTRASWVERWELRGVPELNEALFEVGLGGDSIEAALLTRLSSRLEEARAVTGLVRVLIEVRACALPQLLERAAQRLQQLDLDAVPFSELVEAARTLRVAAAAGPASHVSKQTAPEVTARDLLLRAAVRRVALLPELTDPGAREARALRVLIAEATTTGIGREALFPQLAALATGAQGRPRLRGYALGLALEQALIPKPRLTALLATRLGSVHVGETAAFFEGLLAHDPRALLASPFPEALDAWVRSADPIAFSRGLLPLRRAFARWSPEARTRLAAPRDEEAAPPAPTGTGEAVDGRDERARHLHPPDGPLARALERLDDVEL